MVPGDHLSRWYKYLCSGQAVHSVLNIHTIEYQNMLNHCSWPNEELMQEGTLLGPLLLDQYSKFSLKTLSWGTLQVLFLNKDLVIIIIRSASQCPLLGGVIRHQGPDGVRDAFLSLGNGSV